MIFVQPFLYNFLSHTHIIFLFSLFSFLSLLFLTNEKREQKVVSTVVPKELFKYHYSKKKTFYFRQMFGALTFKHPNDTKRKRNRRIDVIDIT